MKALMVGLDGAGKTAILYRLKLGEMVATIPTMGFNLETVKYRHSTYIIRDAGGLYKIRPLWRHFFDETKNIIYVVDSTNRHRIGEARDELLRICSEDAQQDAVLLVLANKQDLRGAMSLDEISEKLGLDILHPRKWHIQAASATQGQGLYEGLLWLSAVKPRK